ncbi:MAG: hypothetical protein PHV59_13000, partial [Victivallales bacterium]|nr:hypothetical protein [Victivallales bacterium]
RIDLINITPDTPSRSARFTDPQQAKHDPQWGWINFSGAYLVTPNDEFKRFVSGEKVSSWRQASEKKSMPLGKIKAKDGKLIIEGSKAQWTGIWFFRGHQFPKIAVQPGMKLKFTVKASGEGELLLGYYSYAEKSHLGYPLKSLQLGAEPKKLSVTLPVSGKTRFMFPVILVKGPGKAVIEDYLMEVLP